MATKISAEFGCRPDTLPKRLVNALHRRYRKQVASAELIKAVYGAQAKHASHSSLGSRLIKSTIQEQRRGKQRPGNFAPACRNGLRCA